MDGAVGKRRSEGGIDEPVLLDQGQAVERLGDHADLKVIATAGTILHRDLSPGEGVIEERVDRFRSHRQ